MNVDRHNSEFIEHLLTATPRPVVELFREGEKRTGLKPAFNFVLRTGDLKTFKASFPYPIYVGQTYLDKILEERFLNPRKDAQTEWHWALTGHVDFKPEMSQACPLRPLGVQPQDSWAAASWIGGRDSPYRISVSLPAIDGNRPVPDADKVTVGTECDHLNFIKDRGYFLLQSGLWHNTNKPGCLAVQFTQPVPPAFISGSTSVSR